MANGSVYFPGFYSAVFIFNMHAKGGGERQEEKVEWENKSEEGLCAASALQQLKIKH